MERRTAVQGGTTALLRSIKAIAVSGPENRFVWPGDRSAGS
jgi:hypothetical protein